MALASLGTLRAPEPDAIPLPDAANVDIPTDETSVIVDPETGAVTVDNPDGSADIDFSPKTQRNKTGAKDHDANLALYVGDSELTSIATLLLEAIEADSISRSKWIDTRTKGMTLLGLDIEPPRGDTGSSAAPLEGMSSVRHPLLLDACIRFQANARGELLPSDGPVKVKNDGDQTVENDTLAENLETDMNHFLTVTASEYYPDTDRALFQTGFSGLTFKKVYNCPLRRRPVSESVDGGDLIVPASTTDLKNAARITHQIMMRKSVLKRMQILGVYRDVQLQREPTEDPTRLQQKAAEVQGVTPNTQRQEDGRYTIYETYCEIDPSDLGIDEPDAPEGLPLPYKVTVSKDDTVVLEIRRNWKEGDTEFQPTQYFVKYPFVPGFGFYDIGLVNILGNATQALTAAWRISLDSGMFSNFPGFLYAKSAGRQLTNEFRIPPGGGMAIDTGGLPINQAIAQLPYHDVTAGMLAVTQHIEEVGQKLGMTAELNIGEGKQDAPVGTTIALIEQATKVLDAVHKRLHAAQSEEFQLLADRFREDPGAFWRHNKKPAQPWTIEAFLQALNTYGLEPVADPNSSTQAQRILKGAAAVQLAQQFPMYLDLGEALDYALQQGKIPLKTKPQTPQAQPPDPKLIAAQAKHADTAINAQSKQQTAMLQAHETAVESQDKAADRQSRENIALLRAHTDDQRIIADLQKHSTDKITPDAQAPVDPVTDASK